ncbi:hypothetical protein CKAN_01158600 [Cinnamomum micranthum f. kanehirae]|uniref:Uncharacterized protein n=1 Tax=Cinnamomum micranthum f. kanehirae TaxID=337451 RepID=A0A443NWC4_9MAGN|nr:hypothetical protein CKAN_01158600 [Cinnamomum micranthum f. kanehirae]
MNGSDYLCRSKERHQIISLKIPRNTFQSSSRRKTTKIARDFVVEKTAAVFTCASPDRCLATSPRFQIFLEVLAVEVLKSHLSCVLTAQCTKFLFCNAP